MFKTIKTFSLVFLLIAAYSCKKKDDTDSAPSTSSNTGKTQVDVTNPADLIITPPLFTTLDGADVSSKVVVEGSTTKSGTPPAPTDEVTAPIIYDASDENLRVRSDHTLNLGINGGNLDNVAGIYLQVNGSSNYFDSPVTVNANSFRSGSTNLHKNALGKTTKTTTESDNAIDLQIEIPSSITQGTFCVSYCLYTTDDQVGNVITRCIDVQEFGSSNVDFLGAWDFVKAVANIEGEVEIVEKGKPFNWFGDDQTTCTEKEEDIVTSLILRFTSNGGYESDQDMTSSYFAESTTSFDEDSNWVSEPVCSSFTTERDISTENGAWVYNPSTQTLTLFYDEGEYFYDPYFIDLKLVQSGSNMSLVLDFEEESEISVVYDFVRK